MKVTLLNVPILGKVSKEKKQNNVVSTGSASQSALANNTLSELMGRHQVSFNGDLKNCPGKFIYTQKGLVGSDERIEYDKNTHSFSYCERYSGGAIKRMYSYNPESGVQIEKELNKDGSGRQVVRAKDKTSIFTFGAGENIIHERRMLSDGTRFEFDHEAENDRVIAWRYTQGSQEPTVEVYDYSSPVLLSQYDRRVIYQKDYTYPNGLVEERTYNLVSNEIYESKFFNGNRLVRGFKKDLDGRMLWEAFTQQNGLLFEKEYSESGRVSKTIETNFDANSEREKTYDFRGDLVTDVYSEYDKSGKPKKIISYDVQTGRPSKIVNYHSHNQSTEEYFDVYGYLERKVTLKNDKKVSEAVYYPNSSVMKYFDAYTSSGFMSDVKYNKKRSHYDYSARLVQNEYFYGRNITKIEFYNSNENYIERTRVYDLSTGAYDDTFFDRDGVRTKLNEYDASGWMTHEIEFYYNSNIAVSDKLFLKDGSTTQTNYSPQGIVTSRKITSADGNSIICEDYYAGGEVIREKRIYDIPNGTTEYITYDRTGKITNRYTTQRRRANSYNNAYGYRSSHNSYNANNSYGTHNTQNTQRASRTEPPQKCTIEDAVRNISLVVFQDSFKPEQIPYEQWEMFAKLLKIDSVELMLNMDKSVYRKTAKEVHPDLKDEKDKPFYEAVTKIVNSLYDHANKKRSC